MGEIRECWLETTVGIIQKYACISMQMRIKFFIWGGLAPNLCVRKILSDFAAAPLEIVARKVAGRIGRKGESPAELP